MVTVTHTFNCALADDPKAAAAGEVLISHWNAPHTVSGIREVLTANRSYYVSIIGSDSNGGTNSSTDAWATIQHALNVIASTLDINGQVVTVYVGAGSFVGAGLPSSVGGGVIQIMGSNIGGAQTTTITNGPNDGLLNFANCFDINFVTTTGLYVDSVIFNPNSSVIGKRAGFATLVNNSNCGLGNFSSPGSSVGCKFSFAADALSLGVALVDQSVFTVLSAPLFGGYVIAASAQQMWDIRSGSLAVVGGPWFITGTPNFGVFAVVANEAAYVGSSTYSGAATGARWQALNNSSISGLTAQLGTNYFPGDSKGISDSSSSYDGFIGPFSGINVQTGAAYTLTVFDFDGIVEMNNAGANTVTVPPNSSADFPVNPRGVKIVQIGSGATTVAAGAGVTVHNAGALAGQWASAFLYQRSTDEWVMTT